VYLGVYQTIRERRNRHAQQGLAEIALRFTKALLYR
jgi:hypothetical protein